MGSSDSPMYPEDHQGAQYLGVEERGSPMYYGAESNTVYTGATEEGTLTDEWADERSLDDGSLSEFLGTESGGWQSLSEFAKRHLPGVEAGADDEVDR